MTEKDNDLLKLIPEDTRKQLSGQAYKPVSSIATETFKPAPAASETITFDDAGMRTVLYGYGKVAPTYKQHVDNYLFVGGVCRDVPFEQVEAWAKGRRLDGKPAPSRIRLQAVLPNDANDIDFAKAVGSPTLEPDRLVQMIQATEAKALVTAMGRQRAIELAEALLKHSAQR